MNTAESFIQNIIKKPSEEGHVLPEDLHEYLTKQEVEKVAYSSIMEAYRIRLSEKKRAAYWTKLQEVPWPVFMNISQYRGYVLQHIEQKAEKEAWPTAIELNTHLRQLFNELTAYFGGFQQECQIIKTHHRMIIIQGPVGIGKSKLIEAMRINPTQSYYFKTASQIKTEAISDLSTVIEKYSGMLKVVGGSSAHFGQTSAGLCIDDIGTENEHGQLSHYGNKANVIQEIVQERYNRLSSHPYIHTILITNLDKQGIGDNYGPRFYDRLKERAAWFEFNPKTKSFRGQTSNL